jgi:hypothetical protein
MSVAAVAGLSACYGDAPQEPRGGAQDDDGDRDTTIRDSTVT